MRLVSLIFAYNNVKSKTKYNSVAAERTKAFDVTSLERNKTVERNFALMELRNTSVGGGEGEGERT